MSNTLNVAMLSPGELFGGVERQIVDLCLYFQERPEVTILPVLFQEGELSSQLHLHGVMPTILPAHCRYDVAQAGHLASYFARHHTDVVHVHGYKAMIVAALASTKYHVPIVKTVHGRPEPTGRSLTQHIKSLANSWMDERATRIARASICYVTYDISKGFDHAHRTLSRKVIHNGIIPLSRAGRPRPTCLVEGLFHAGIVGRVSEVKGIVHSLRALTSNVIPAHVRLDIIGTGPLLEALRDEADVLGVVDKVRFHGFQRNILDWIANLDALLMPSLHEGLPYTLLEAMSLGIPIIASRVGGLAEVLQHMKTGILVEVGDAHGIASALAQLAGDPAFGRRLGDAAASEQRKQYTLEHMINEYLQIYSATVSGRRPETSG